MFYKIILLVTLISTSVFGNEIQIPDDFKPIESTSEILFSHEFDEKPKFMTKINENEFIIFDIHDEVAKLYSYKVNNNSLELKSEFIINAKESIDDFQIHGDKLKLLFVNYAGDIGNNNAGYYWRETIIDLNTYKPVSSKIIFTTIDKKEFELEDYNEDLDYAENSVDSNMFLLYVRGNKQIEIEPSEYSSFYDTYNSKDSSRKNFLSMIHERDSKILYLRATNFESSTSSPKSFLVELLDSTDINRSIGIHWTYLDENSNLYFLFSWHDKKQSKRFLSFNKFSPDGELRYYFREVETEIDSDDDYVIHDFETFKKDGNKIKAIGLARESGSEALGVQPIAAIYIAEFDLNTLVFDLKTKILTASDGYNINNKQENLKFNLINKVIETPDGYTILAEHNLQHIIVNTAAPRGVGLNIKYNHYYHTINLFALDKDLNFKWNRLIKDRELHNFRSIWGQSRTPIDRYANHVGLQPKLDGETISFVYSTDHDESINKIKYNITNGELIEETPIFKNDGIASFCTGYQFPLGNNEFVTMVIEDDIYLVRYKLLK